MKPRLIAHGGAWDWSDEVSETKAAGLVRALTVGTAVLDSGGSALDAVEATVRCLEDDPAFDAGTGGYLNQDGDVELDALIVDGSKLDFGAVAGMRAAKNPITLARHVLEDTEQCFYVGGGADRLLDRFGIERVENSTLVTPPMREFWETRRTDGHDTVGAVALDADGRLAAATSTSGTPYKPQGRVGDSPMYGAGGYADARGAAGATGYGEQMMRTLLSKVVCDEIAAGNSADEAAAAAVARCAAMVDEPMIATIAIDADGNYGAAQTTPKLARGWVDDDGIIHTAMES